MLCKWQADQSGCQRKNEGKEKFMKNVVAIVTLVFVLCVAQPGLTQIVVEENSIEVVDVDDVLSARFAGLALDCVHRQYPNKISHVLTSDADAKPPKSLYPVFYGCFDWHSSVHGHWLLVRLLRTSSDSFSPEFRQSIMDALQQSFTAEGVAGEVIYFDNEDRKAFERPYGLAWFLQLTAELRLWDDPQAAEWLGTLMPLEAVIVQRIKSWVPKLAYPIRVGTHNQSMFAFGLMLDWAQVSGDSEMQSLLTERSLAFHKNDLNCPISYEPSGEDFLSPCLMEADLMRRVLPADEFPLWLSGFLPEIPTDGSTDWLVPGIVNDPTDGKLVHLDGVNLSRAWNLKNISAALGEGDPRVSSLQGVADTHANEGIANVSSDNYAGSHWLASFATYLITTP
jgi:hypothetical protein